MWTGFFIWLNAQVDTFISTQVANVADLLAPTIVTLATIYIMSWGYLHLTGQIQEPILDGAKRVFTLAAVLAFTLGLASNITPILDVFVNGPQQLAAGVLGGTPLGTVDTIWTDGTVVADRLLQAGSIFELSGLSYIAAGVICYAVIGITTVYVAFLIALALVALAVLLALGPLFICLVFFDSTKRFFEAWIAQLANYSLVIVLISTVANLLLQALQTPLNAALASGDGVTIAEGFRMCVFALFVFLIMRQVLPMAAGLASGIALASGNVVSRSLLWGMGASRNAGRGLWDSATRQGTTRWDPMSRKAGYYLGQGARQTARAAWRAALGRNAIRDRTPATRAPTPRQSGDPPPAAQRQA